MRETDRHTDRLTDCVCLHACAHAPTNTHTHTHVLRPLTTPPLAVPRVREFDTTHAGARAVPPLHHRQNQTARLDADGRRRGQVLPPVPHRGTQGQGWTVQRTNPAYHAEPGHRSAENYGGQQLGYFVTAWMCNSVDL